MLTNASDALARSFERLASGQRINSASDDAAGLAVADNLRVRTRLYSGAIRNINDGLSAMNIADGAVTQQSLLVTRLAELAEQAANGSLSNTQRRSLDAEYQALVAESGRIGAVTNFNGVALLLGTRDANPLALTLQAGINGNQNSQISFNRTDVGQFSGVYNLNNASLSGAKYFDWLVANFGKTSFTTDELATAFGGSIARVTTTDSTGAQRQALVAIAGQGNAGNALMMIAFTQSSSDPNKWENEIDAGDFDDYVAGGQVTFNSNGQITNAGASSIVLECKADTACNVTLDLRALLVTGNSTAYGTINNGATGSAIDFTNVLSQSGAQMALDVARQRVEELAKLRGQFGAVQSRLSSAVSLAQITRENSAAAESRIRDVDVAEETSNLVASQVKQQLASVVLRQVNSYPKILLSLLQ